MPRSAYLLLPRVQSHFTSLGERLRLACLRRRLALAMVAERAGISVTTLRFLEQVRAAPSVGALMSVLFVLGFEKEMDLVACDDELGRKLQDAGLPTRVRAPRKKADGVSASKGPRMSSREPV